MNPPTTTHPSRSEHPPISEGASHPSPVPSPLTEAEQHEREAYVERNLWLALIGLLLFALALWGA